MKMSWLRLFLPVFVATFSMGAQAQSNLFVWDMGDVPGQADANDYIMDLTKECGEEGALINSPEDQRASVLPKWTRMTDTEVWNVFKDIAPTLTPSVPFYFGAVSVMDSHKGAGGPLFLLLPEIHYVESEALKKSHYHSNHARAMTALYVTFVAQSQGIILNLGEQSRTMDMELVRRPLDPSLTNHEDQARYLMRTYGLGPFEVLFNLYHPPQMFHAYIDSPTMMAKQIMFAQGFDGSQSFDDVYAKARVRHDYGQSNYQSAYNSLVGKTARELRSEERRLCDDRSFYMIDKALGMVEDTQAVLVIIRYGTAHHKHMARILRDSGQSYIALTPAQTPPP